MVDIPPSLRLSIKRTLMLCPQFESNTLLRAMFADALIAPWRRYIQETDNIDARASLVINRLRDQTRTDTGMNVLWLLLCVLKDDIDDPTIDLYKELDKVARDLDNALRSTTSPHLPPSSLLEANPDNLPMIPTNDIKELLKNVPAVGKVSVLQVIDGKLTGVPFSGTGWLIAPDLLLTCLHVIEARTKMQRVMRQRITNTDRDTQVQHSSVTFDYTSAVNGVEYRMKKLECYDPLLDYALISLEDSHYHPLSSWGCLKLGINTLPRREDSLYIIQHPKGRLQQTSLGRYMEDVPSTQGRSLYIRHNAPSEEGTSGAPILKVNAETETETWKVVALHTSEDDTNRVRQATLLSVILSDIEKKERSLHSRILEATKGK